MRTQKAIKQLRESEVIPPGGMSKSELKALTINFKVKGPLRLGTGEQIRGEMKRVYRAVVGGDLPLSAGTKLLFMLDKIAKSKSEDEKLKILERGGMGGAPFVGLMLTGPDK